MTEYDYSPEAYERYTRTQQRIASWVDQTEEYRPHFGSGEEQMTPRGPAPFLQSATKNLQSMFRRRRRSSSSSSSDSSSGAYASNPRSPGPMPAFQPMNLQQQQSPPFIQNQHSRAHNHSSSHRPSSHSHKPHRSAAYVMTTPPATVPGYAYVYNNAQGSPGVMIVPPKGSAATSPPTSYYQPTAPVSGYPFPQTVYPHTAPPAGSFTYAPHGQPHPPNRPAMPQIYSQTAVPQIQPQTQYPQTTYPPTVYPLTPYTAYPQQQAQAPPQIIYERSSRKKHHRSGSSRRSR